MKHLFEGDGVGGKFLGALKRMVAVVVVNGEQSEFETIKLAPLVRTEEERGNRVTPHAFADRVMQLRADLKEEFAYAGAEVISRWVPGTGTGYPVYSAGGYSNCVQRTPEEYVPDRYEFALKVPFLQSFAVRHQAARMGYMK